VSARKVEDKTLTLIVSGKLWNRSLVMADKETGTEWSHLLGRGMKGPLKGVELEPLPADMTTWAAWKERYPKTTVLNLSRKRRFNYDKDFYKRPEQFVLGWLIGADSFHVSYATLNKKPVLNLTVAETPVVVTYHADSTSARVFSRKLGDRLLTFEASEGEAMKDEQTGSTWNRATGVATDGALKGNTLEHHVGIPSFKRAWNIFHPESELIEGE